jgi:hypothetical protein
MLKVYSPSVCRYHLIVRPCTGGGNRPNLRRSVCPLLNCGRCCLDSFICYWSPTTEGDGGYVRRNSTCGDSPIIC